MLTSLNNNLDRCHEGVILDPAIRLVKRAHAVNWNVIDLKDPIPNLEAGATREIRAGDEEASPVHPDIRKGCFDVEAEAALP